MPPHARFRDLIVQHLDAGYNLARWLARDADDAQDVVQDACMRALKYADSLQGNDARAWFLTIVRHAFYDWCKRNRPSEIAHDDGAALDAAIANPAMGPEPSAIRGAETRALSEALSQLPLQYREVIVLRELEELSYKQIARVVDVPVGTVMSRLSRARALLQRSPMLHAIRGQSSGGES